MKNCRLTININRPVSDVFGFTLDPKNTPLWVDSIVKEEVNEVPTKVGTKYRNVDKAGVWSEYLVTKYEKDKLFEFTAADKNYHVLYTFTQLSESSCKLEYFEWVENGELDAPFTLHMLEKLKLALEK
jgi:hypothetical protein